MKHQRKTEKRKRTRARTLNLCTVICPRMPSATCNTEKSGKNNQNTEKAGTSNVQHRTLQDQTHQRTGAEASQRAPKPRYFHLKMKPETHHYLLCMFEDLQKAGSGIWIDCVRFVSSSCCSCPSSKLCRPHNVGCLPAFEQK